jgi:hypothetical protein
MGKRLTDPVEGMTQQIAERVLDLLVTALDINALVARVDLDEALRKLDPNRLLDRVDVNRLLDRVDVNALLDRVDVNRLLDRVDVNALLDRADVDGVVRRVGETDLGALIARSSGGVASEALDAARSQAVGLDQFIDRWTGRLLRRKRPGPSAPAAVLAARNAT